MADHSMMKLGKQAARIDSRTLKLSRYFLTDLPPAPPKVTWSQGKSGWGMMVNDQLGCCTIAGAFHQAQVWKLNTTNVMYSVADSDIIRYYSAWDGYDPKQLDPGGNNPTDQGGVELDVLNDWRQQDLLGTKLLAYADSNVKNLEHVRQAINLFGGVYIGVELPISAQTQDTWDTTTKHDNDSMPGSWGGHCVCIPDYDEVDDTFTCITWGILKKMTTRFFLAYCDEVHALLSPDWFKEGKSLLGFDLPTLEGDLKNVTA